MHPCLQVMSKFSLRIKLLGMFGSILLIGLLFAVVLLTKQNNQIGIAQNELLGVGFGQVNTELAHILQQMRLSARTQANPSKIQQALKKAVQSRTDALAKTDPFELSADWKPIADALLILAEQKKITQQDIPSLNASLEKLLAFNELLNEKSGLLFDPEANTYLLMDLGLQKLPVWIDNLSRLSFISAEAFSSASTSTATVAEMQSLRDRLLLAMRNSESVAAALLRADVAKFPAQQSAFEASQQFVTQLQKHYFSELQATQADAVQKSAEKALTQVYLFERQTQTLLKQLLQERVQQLSRHSYVVIFSLLISMFMTIYLSFGFYLNLILAVESLEHAAEVVASGDLTSIVKVQGSDELSKTAIAIDKANFNLSALVANVRTNASMVLDLGKELSEGINDMAVRTELQASSLVDTAHSMETLSETVRMNAANAKSVDNLASNVRMIAESSNDTMRAAVQTMQGIHTSAMKVQEIVSMIDKIAFQTDILALNAAVEASHAGEQGKGFAVVANEVRNLAQRSADAARQIRRLIDDSVNRVETGVEQIYEVNETLSDIVGGIRNLAKDINAISTASNEQSQSLTHISDAIRELDSITKSNSDMVENAKSASAGLEVRAAHLTSVVSAFKLRQGSADEARALVKNAMSLFSIYGMDLLDRITQDPEKLYADRDMYVFAFDRQGQYRAFAGNAAKLSVNLFKVPGLDGRKLVEEAFSLPDKGGWVDYAIENPLLNRVELKTSYIERISDDIVIGCGVYKSA
jgi:methyl-accepting chemotaxis protein